MAYITENMKSEEREEFMAELYGTETPESAAKDQLKAHMAAQGIEWDGSI